MLKCGRVGHFARRSKREAVTVVGMGQYVVAAEEEKAEAIRAGEKLLSSISNEHERAWQLRSRHMDGKDACRHSRDERTK